MRTHLRTHCSALSPIWRLAWPAILELLFQTAVSYADTAMVGRLGAAASASVGLTGSVLWLISCTMSALGIGCVAYIARAIGGGQQEKAHRAAMQSFWLVLLMGLVLGLAAWLVHPRLPVWMNADPAIQADASRYFLIITLPMVFRASVVIFGSVLRGAGDTRSPMVNNVIMNLANVVLNFFLIYPTRTWQVGGVSLILPGLGWGVTGAAVATALSFVLGGTFMFLAVWRHPAVTPSVCRLTWDNAVLGAIVKVGLPVMLQRIINCLGYIAFAALVARLGTISLAANSIAISAEELFYVAGYGVQSAAATLAGNALGANDPPRFHWVARYTTGLTVVLLTCSGIMLFLFPVPIMSLFSSDQAVIRLGAAVLRIVALSEPIYGVLVVLEGIFDGIGDTKAPVYYALATMWGVRILFSALCILVLHLGLRAVWCCMVADNVLRAVLLTMRYLRGKWKYRFAT